MSAIDLLQSRMKEIEALCTRYGVARLRLFGSALRPDWDDRTSDFDFLVALQQLPNGVRRQALIFHDQY